MPDTAIVFDHIAFGVPKVADAVPFLVGTLGGAPFEGGPGPGFAGGQWRFARGGVLEVIQPDASPESFLARFLARRGPGVHHVTFKVPDLRAAAANAEARGYGIVGYDDRNPGWKEAFLHPKEAQGIVVQLAESHPEMDDAWGPDWSFPPGPPDPPPPAEIVGLELASRSEERARTLWEATAGGRAEPDGADRRVFRWPGSPMRIAVRIDPAAEEGPLAVEVRADRPLALPDGPHPVLGAPFVAV